ncbi:MAG: AAA family ATPase [Dehalococcoidia bacterium]|nr:AAA family ATPase [Dehalococcoidia bacterium]
MILRQVAVKRFRRFADFTLDLSPGLNVIYGNNELGKTTLHDALLLGLFTRPTVRNAEVRETRSWNNTALPEVTLVFAFDDQSFSLVKDFESKGLALTNQLTGSVSRDPAAAESVVTAAIGLGTASLFRATAFIGQDRLADLASEKDLRKSLGDELQRVVTGGGDDVVASTVLKKLDDKIGHLQKGTTGMAREPGEIRAARDKLADLSGKIAERRGQLAAIDRSQDDLTADEKKLAVMLTALDDARRLKERYLRRQQVKSDLDATALQEDELDQKIESTERLQREITGIETNIAPYGQLQALDSATIARLASANEAINLHAQQVQEVEQEIALAETVSGAGAGSTIPVWLLPLGLALAASGLIGAFYSVYLLAIALLGAVLVAFDLGRRRSPGPPGRDTTVQSPHTRLEEARRRLSEAKSERQETLSRFPGKNYGQLLEEYETYRRLHTELGQAKARLDGLLGGRTVEELERSRREISRKRRDCQEILTGPELVNAEMDPLAFTRLARQIDATEAEATTLHEAVLRNRAIIENSPFSAVDVHRLAEEQAIWTSQLERAQRRLLIYQTARQTIETAKNRVLIAAKHALEAEMGEYLSTITGGRYREVSVDERTLSFTVQSLEKDVDPFIDPQISLSRGAQDQFYLAARLSLLKFICGGKKPPLLLDDPFVAFDQSRLENTMQLCRELAKSHQILLFTCNGIYRKWADNFIALSM